MRWQRPDPADPVIFQRGGSLCRIVRPSPGLAPSIMPLGLDALHGQLDRAASWARPRARIMAIGSDTVPHRSKSWGRGVPRGVRSFAVPDRRVRGRESAILAGRKAGHEARVRPEGRFWYAPTADLAGLEVPVEPSDAEVESARSLLVNDLLADFPFANHSSRATLLLTLLPFVRLMIDGATPNHHVGASTAGTGKGLCAHASLPSLGREIELTPQKESDAEYRKALTSLFARPPNTSY